ncbi:putative mitochondrial heat shock protein 20 [Leptomonas pyrrhocoris]|uniref:Putative mitochondrial heat shock protein 20 n=1 Tax=Leptomonas pyrrhocoris TaxID=157538 RepID=A0A0N0DVV3_LEPPY|nr:putative mitochondrial heat shock protein 20 [Leptomonas pyrrhocoris]KPA80654.1 putative mitochondrial heat shock protein 20 [Leptomonas pyrrhocoris]|eukprot:XP_015659093.1 putative mitochondrial heat shock protein 20 [Leptomonas pyrrhocoris]
MPRRSDSNNDDAEGFLGRQAVFPFAFPLFGNPTRSNMFNSFFSSRSRGEWIPAVDISEQNDSYTLISDLPEMKKEDVRVYTESSSAICISGIRRHLEEQSDRPLIVAERGVGRFERCFDLPSKLDETSVRASFKDSQLVVTIPKLSTSASGSSGSIKIE